MCGKIGFPPFDSTSKRRGNKVWGGRSKPFLTILDGNMKNHQLFEEKAKNTLAIIINIMCWTSIL